MSEWKFNRDAIGAFRFVRCGFDADTGVAQLVYAFDDGPEMIETITVPGAPFALDAERCIEAIATAPAPTDIGLEPLARVVNVLGLMLPLLVVEGAL